MKLPLVPRALSEVVDPQRTALVVWDMQTALAARADGADACTEKIRELLDAARGAGVMVVYSRHVAPPLELMSPSALRSLMRQQNATDPAMVKPFMQAGTPDVEIVPALAPRSDELVVDKSTPSLFIGTPVERRLHARDVRTIVLSGIATERGVEMTARHALALGFFAVVAEDACAAFSAEAHALGLAYLRTATDVVPAAEIARVWAEGRGMKAR